MRRWILVILVLCLMAERADARSLDLQGRAGDYDVAVSLARNPPVVGENPLEIGIRDSRGMAVKDAKVLVHYYMPPMPRMAPMSYTTPAGQSGLIYRTSLRIIMSGPWVVAVKITLGKKTTTAKFRIDVP